MRDEGRRNLTEEAFKAIESLGSTKIRQLEYRDMWALIGRKGASSRDVLEGHEPAQANGAVVLKDTLSFLFNRGHILSNRIGPATKWSRLNWNVALGDSSDFYINVLGYNKAIGDTIRLFSKMKEGDLDVSSVDAQKYPYLYLDRGVKLKCLHL